MSTKRESGAKRQKVTAQEVKWDVFRRSEKGNIKLKIGVLMKLQYKSYWRSPVNTKSKLESP